VSPTWRSSTSGPSITSRTVTFTGIPGAEGTSGSGNRVGFGTTTGTVTGTVPGSSTLTGIGTNPFTGTTGIGTAGLGTTGLGTTGFGTSVVGTTGLGTSGLGGVGFGLGTGVV
jgi:hypothetical protein